MAAIARIAFWFRWFLAFLGFPIGGLVAQGFTAGVQTPPEGLIGGAAAGAVIGAAQWLALRGRLTLSPLWIPASAAGLGIGLLLGVTAFGTETSSNALLYRGLVAGAGVAVLQAWMLHRAGREYRWWTLFVTFGWAIGWAVTRAAGVDLRPDFAVFGSTGAWAFQALTALGLRTLLSRRALRV
jgi:hypothetical protein